MAFINVAEWTPDNVAQWLQGLEDCIQPYVHFFFNNQINGCRLLLLSSDDLVKLNVTKIGHQEIILDGVDLLKHLHYNFNSETLKSLALRLGCKSRSLYNQLKQEQEELQRNNLNSANSQTGSQSSAAQAITKGGTLKHSKHGSSSHKNSAKNQEPIGQQSSTSNKVSTKTLFAVCDLLNAAKTFISWIDRYPFDKEDAYKSIRKAMLKQAIELASTAQRDQFADRPNDFISEKCRTFAGLCDRIVQDIHDSLSIQPASLDVALIKKRSNEELGMHIHSSYSGIHIISGIKQCSATNNCGRIDEGDEIVQVNYRTVVGWQLRKLVDIMKEYQTELILTLKKRPKHCASMSSHLIKPFKSPLREYSNQHGDLDSIRMNGSMTLKPMKPRKPLPNEYSNEYCNLDQIHQQIDAQMLNGSISKGKAAIRRRATISGSTSSLNTCGQIRVDDILIRNYHALTKIQNESKTSLDQQSNSSVPYAKVPPLQQSEQDSDSSATKQTVPKQVTNASTFSVSGSPNGKSVATIKMAGNENVGIVPPNNTSRTSDQPLKLSTFQTPETSSPADPPPSTASNLSSNDTPPSLPPNKPPIRQRNANGSLNSSVNSGHSNSGLPPLPAASEKPAIPQRPASKSTPSSQPPITTIQLNRFVTLKQIEEENSQFFKDNPASPLCQLISNSNSSTNNNTIDKQFGPNECNNLLSGWLYTKREHFNTLLNANAKWSAKYVQLTTNYLLYAFRNEHATKADLVINLAAFKVSPACECKSKENVFKTFNKHVIFLFSCESQAQMRQWVDTLRQLVANCASTKPDLMRLSSSPDVACYSETEDEEDVIDDEMMLQNFANELAETNKREQEKEEETIESKIDLIKTDPEKAAVVPEGQDTFNEEIQIKPVKLADLNSTPSKPAPDQQQKQANNEPAKAMSDEDDEKHNRRMARLLDRRRQRYTSTAESYRDSSPSSTTSSASSSANTSSASAGQAVISRLTAISDLKERLQKQAQEKLEQRRMLIASGKRMFERSASCMDASTVSNLHSRLAAVQSNTTNNTPVKGSGALMRPKSGSQQSLLSPTANEAFDLPLDARRDHLPAKPFYMTSKNKVLPPIPPLPPRPPKPTSISITSTTDTVSTSSSHKPVDKAPMPPPQSNTDELNKRSQPQPQPRTSKNGLSAAVADDQQQLADTVNKENINSSNSILKKSLQGDASKQAIPNHKDNEYISNIIDELYNFSEESKPVISSKPVLQSSQVNQVSQPSQPSELLTSAPVKKADAAPFQQQATEGNFGGGGESYSMLNYQPNFGGNQMPANGGRQMNCQFNQAQLQQLESMLIAGQGVAGLPELEGEDLDGLDSFDDEECLDDEEFSDEECDMNLNDYNKMYSSASAQSKPTNFGQQESNLFGFGSNAHHEQANHAANSSASANGVGFLAPGPNFLNSAPGSALAHQHQQASSLLNNHHHHHQSNGHSRSDLGSSSNSNNYPTSPSSNSFNISPYSSISQHNNQPSADNLPLQMDGAFNSQISQLDQFSQLCNVTDEQLSDSSSGVSSYVSAVADQHSLQYLQNIISREALEALPEEEKARFIQEFRDQFIAQFTLELLRQQQLQQQLLLAQQQQAQQQPQNQQQVQQQIQQQQQQFLQNLQQNQLAMNPLMQQQLMALAAGGNNANMPFAGQLLNAAAGQQLMNHQAMNGRLQHELENLEDEEDDLCDSDDLTYDEEEDSDFEFDENEVDGLERPDQTKAGRKLSRFRLFGQSPKLLKKFKNKSLKHQKDKRTTGHNTTVKPGDTTDAPTAWISMGAGKMLDEDQNLVDQPQSPSEKSISEEKDRKTPFADEADVCSIKSLDKEQPAKKSASREKLSATTTAAAAATETSTSSLNSSQSSFVQLTTKPAEQPATDKDTPKHSPKTSTSLASKWFGRKSTGDQPEKQSNDGKKKPANKSAPQITQVIYKRKPNLPELPASSSSSDGKDQPDAPLPPAKPKALKQTVSVPSDEETDLDDRIYAEINETALVLEEMKRSLDKNSTERKIIEMILQQPASDGQLSDPLKVK